MRARDLVAFGTINVIHAGLIYTGQTPSSLAALGIPEAVILDGVKDELKRTIDADAEAARLRVITPGAGQAAEYQQAQAEAVAALSKPGGATADKFPMLAASIGIDIDPATGVPAADVLGVARAVQAAADAWKAIGASIRKTRLQAKAAIDAAATFPEACAAFDAISWAPPQAS